MLKQLNLLQTYAILDKYECRTDNGFLRHAEYNGNILYAIDTWANRYARNVVAAEIEGCWIELTLTASHSEFGCTNPPSGSWKVRAEICTRRTNPKPEALEKLMTK